ncbi:MAG: hypothetical protein KA956_05340 [Pyrinomonadaceae bacterium]|nr:hypothetical protein [Acidobacteriota bacterium]MBK7934655.1 hypothetical protein [Acidobacteriota bacterium]MBP7375879.1 hypothetical protein [Pyrinomonadaceae bacterium]
MKCRILFVAIFVFLAAISAIAQTERTPFSSYKGVSIGIPIENARAILGNPKEKADKQDFYLFSENESMQVFYEDGKTVTAIMMTFVGAIELAPTAKDVFGEEVAASEDGSFFKMMRYPKAGFWISYSHAATADKMINIAMQKIN